jgi:acetolactate synthase-1/2/3 large subunit
MITGAEAIVRSLELEGVEVIFGYPGATVCPLYDKLSKSTKIKHILVRHEQHAGLRL